MRSAACRMSYKYILGSRRIEQDLGLVHCRAEVRVPDGRGFNEVDGAAEQGSEILEQPKVRSGPAAGRLRREIDEEVEVAASGSACPIRCRAEQRQPAYVVSPAQLRQLIPVLLDLGNHGASSLLRG